MQSYRVRESPIPTIPCDKVIQIRFNGNSYKSNLFDGVAALHLAERLHVYYAV